MTTDFVRNGPRVSGPSPHRKCTCEQVIQIRNSESPYKYAATQGISSGITKSIRKGRTYKECV